MPDLFPFSKIREGQKQLIDKWRQCIAGKKCLLAHAPTGIGKTAAVLAPALEYALENNLIVIFLTPRHSQHKIVIETLRQIKKKAEASASSAKIKAADIIGKKWLCSLPDISDLSQGDFEAYCKMLKKEKKCDFLNRTWLKEGGPTDEAKRVLETVENEIMHSEDVKSLCESENVCASEIFVEASKSANIIIADYFHIFHPEIRKNFCRKLGKSLEDAIIIVDEAHNVPSRVRGLLSNQLSSFQLDRAISEARAFGYHGIADDLSDFASGIAKLSKDKLEKEGRGLRQECFVKKEDVSGIIGKIMGCGDADGGHDGGYGSFLDSLEDAAEKVREERKKSFTGGVAHFLSAWRGPDMGFARILRKSQERKGEFSLCYECLDPRIAASEIFSSAHSAAIMSGTMNPLEMYEGLFGLEPCRTEKLILKSPFPSENKLCLVMGDVTTRFAKRSEEGLLKIAGNLVKIINKSRGNIGVFFPSYSLRDTIYAFIGRSIEKKAIIEKPQMSKEEKAAMYFDFAGCAKKGGGGALLGVIGGNFSEGVDFPGEIMNAAVIVGIPLEKPDLLTEALISYYDFRFNRGWDYGYVYPAITKALQAAGRPIRSETDRAVIVFMDERYMWGSYKKVLPPDMDLKISKDIGKEVEDFFRQRTVKSIEKSIE